MKPNLIILTILIFVFCGFNKTNEVNIIGKIYGKIPKEVLYSVPINGVSYGGFREAAKVDSMGNFQIKMYLEEPAIVNLIALGIFSKKLIVEPGDNFNIIIEIQKESTSLKISGANEAGQNLYNTLPNPSSIQLEARKFSNDTSINSIMIKISSLKTDDISKFKELLTKKEISKPFFNLLSVDRECYYAALTTTIPLLSFFKTDPDHLDKFPLELKKMWEDVYIKCPLSKKELLYSPWWFEYAKTYINYKEFFSESFKVQNLEEFYEKGLIHTHNLDESKKYLFGQGLEYYDAAYIFYECLQKKYEKEFITIFEQFKTDFPKSKYIKYLEPMVNPILEFHKITGSDIDENIKYIDNFEKMGTLKEVIKSFKGKKIYIDVWATWCGPCIAQFENKESLYKLLKSEGIEIVYISIDKDDKEKQWRKMVEFYNLEGNHLRANVKLNEDLERIHNQNGTIIIPWYILIDKNGNIVKDHAKKPSEIEGLRKEINAL